MLVKHIVFLINLLQDINIVRPLAYLAARELDASILFMLSDKFIERDKQGIWQLELKEICRETNSTSYIYDSEYSAFDLLLNKRGIIIAASESNLSAHAHTHNIFRVAPASFLKITLQHGYECVGFFQNREHYKAHGRNVTFAADLVCGWRDVSAMQSLAASERSKYYWTGPTSLLSTFYPTNTASNQTDQDYGGLVCENLHSVRMNVNGDFKASFMDTFFAFCEHQDKQGKSVTLRPHPGGQYVVKNNIELPENVRLNNLPMYKVNLAQYKFGISAPSSVVIDMVLAGIPVAVWQDDDEVIDASSYEGLTIISGLNDWLAFERDVAVRPEMLLARQARFLQRIKMLTDAQEIHTRFVNLLSNGLSVLDKTHIQPRKAARILFVANAFIPTLQLSFYKPLAPEIDVNNPTMQLITAEDIKAKFKGGLNADEVKTWLVKLIEDFNPSIIVFCRYSDRFSEHIVNIARVRNTPVIFHIDDDLLNVPIEIGEQKYKMHNSPERLAAVSYLLTNADLVYCSTEPLLKRFREQGFCAPMITGKIYCAGEVLKPTVLRPVRKVGYMGFDHAHDLEIILPVLVDFLNNHPTISFELFGSIPKPSALDQFGERITVIPPVRNYADFLTTFAELEWDIGVCPLADTAFNRVKANTKWVEYTSVGAAVIATKGMAYDECCADGCGELVVTQQEWADALESLCTDPELRYQRVNAAQARLMREYSVENLSTQVKEVFRYVTELQCQSSQRIHTGDG